MELAAVIVSGLSLVIAIAGTTLANKRSKEALDESRKAAASALWSNVQQAVQRFIGFDPTMEPVGDRLANFRIATIALVDELEGWEGLDTWLEAERTLGAILGRQVMESARPGAPVDERLANLDPYQRWAQVLGQNLRRFRKVGFDAAAVAQLQTSAEGQIKAISAKHGWALPPTTIHGVTTIDQCQRQPVRPTQLNSSDTLPGDEDRTTLSGELDQRPIGVEEAEAKNRPSTRANTEALVLHPGRDQRPGGIPPPTERASANDHRLTAHGRPPPGTFSGSNTTTPSMPSRGRDVRAHRPPDVLCHRQMDAAGLR